MAAASTRRRSPMPCSTTETSSSPPAPTRSSGRSSSCSPRARPLPPKRLALDRLEAQLAEVAGTELELERPAKAEHGDYATNVAMRLAGSRRQAPRAIAEELAAAALALPEVERTEVAGPGFLNLWLTPSWFGDALGEILEQGPAYGGGG